MWRIPRKGRIRKITIIRCRKLIRWLSDCGIVANTYISTGVGGVHSHLLINNIIECLLQHISGWNVWMAIRVSQAIIMDYHHRSLFVIHLTQSVRRCAASLATRNYNAGITEIIVPSWRHYAVHCVTVGVLVYIRGMVRATPAWYSPIVPANV